MPAIVAACLGSLCGITASYSLGRFGGIPLIRKYGHLVHLSEKELRKVRNWFSKTGRWALFFGYFIPGVRHLSAYAAGTSGLEYPVFAMFAYAGGVIWASGFVCTGFFLGKEWDKVADSLHRGTMIALGIAAAAVTLFTLATWWKFRHGRS